MLRSHVGSGNHRRSMADHVCTRGHLFSGELRMNIAKVRMYNAFKEVLECNRECVI